MSISGLSRDTESNLDQYERRLRAGRVRAASAEDAGLLDLARRLAPVRWSPHDEEVAESDRRGAGPMQAPEATTLEAPVAFVPVGPTGSAARAPKRPRISGFGVASSRDPRSAGRAPAQRSGGSAALAWALAPAGAALFGAALVIAVFAPKGGSPGAPEAIAAGERPAEAPQPSGETIAAKGDVDANRPNAVASVKVIGPGRRPTDRGAEASPAPTHPSAPSAGTSAGPSVAAPAAPVARVEVAALSPTPSQSPDSAPRRTASAPPEAIAAPPAQDAGEAAPAAAPQRAAAPAPAGETRVVAVAQPTALKLDSRAKLVRRTSVRVTAAKTGVAVPGAGAETRREPHPPPASAAPALPQAALAPADPETPVNLVAHAFGALAGALGAPTADQTASNSGDWAIQFAAPKSQAEAEAAAARLNAKYAGALNGATIGVHKTEVNGETIYALRVAGLSKAEAAALCVRVKGRDCSIVN